MKKKKLQKRNTIFPIVLICSGLGIVLVFTILLWINDSDTEKIPEHGIDELKARYDYLLDHVTTTNVHPLLRPVHFSVGNKFASCGTMVLKSDGNPYQIVTANHLFSETQPGTNYYDYHVLSRTGYISHGHISRVILDSMRSSNMGIQDVALCYMGDPVPIVRTSKVRVSAESPIEGMFRAGKIDKVIATSLTTGEKYDIIGQIVSEDSILFFVMLYRNLNGESGSGFWGNDNILYIVSGSTPVTKRLRRDLDIPMNYEFITMMSAAKINW